MFRKEPPKVNVKVREKEDSNLIEKRDNNNITDKDVTDVKASVLRSLQALWYARWVVVSLPTFVLTLLKTWNH